jgi:hypothetical protein
MAAPVLPTLTWKRSAVMIATDATPAKVLGGIYHNISSSNYWYPSVIVNSASGDTDYLIVRPRLTTDTPAALVQPALTAQRMIIAGNGAAVRPSTTSMGFGVNTATSTNHIPACAADQLCMNYIPEGRSGSADLGATIDSFFPYTKNARATGYYGIADLIGDPDADDTYSTWIIESEEVLVVCIENTSNSDSGFGFVAGAIMRPPTTGSNDCDVDNRLYGSICFGDNFETSWQSYLNQGWSDSTTDLVNVYRAVAFDPTDTTTGSAARICALTRVEELDTNSTNMVTGDGAFLGIPMNFFTSNHKATGSITPNRFLGTMRQIRYVRDFQARIIIQDGAGTTVGFAWGSHPTADTDAVGFTNS